MLVSESSAIHQLRRRSAQKPQLDWIADRMPLEHCAVQQHNQDDNQPDGQKLQLQVIRRPGQRVKADRYAPRVLKLVGEGQSYLEISHRLGLSKNTILDIVKRDRAA